MFDASQKFSILCKVTFISYTEKDFSFSPQLCYRQNKAIISIHVQSMLIYNTV